MNRRAELYRHEPAKTSSPQPNQSRRGRPRSAAEQWGSQEAVRPCANRIDRESRPATASAAAVQNRQTGQWPSAKDILATHRHPDHSAAREPGSEARSSQTYDRPRARPMDVAGLAGGPPAAVFSWPSDWPEAVPLVVVGQTMPTRSSVMTADW